MNSARIGIVGGGLGGLAAACTAAARGHSVTLFERNAWLGGKAAVLERDGFRFDMGPTILTLPSVLRRIFSEADANLDDYLDLIRLDPQWRAFFADGSRLDLVEDTAAMARRIEDFSDSANGKNYERFLLTAERMHEVSRRFFFWKSIGGIRDMLDLNRSFDLKTLRDVAAMRFEKTVSSFIRSHFKNRKVAQLLDHFTQYVGSSPEASPALLCGIAHMQTSEGIWYPRGGTRAVPEALERLGRELGVEFITDAEVQKISCRNDAAAIESAGGGTFEFDAVISNADAVRTHEELIDEPAAARAFLRRRKYEPACSGIVLYLGLRKKYPHLAHHNFVFSKDPHEEFDFIYRRGEPAPDPTCYVCAPAAAEPEVAPRGGEALYVLVHTPYLRPHHHWERMFPKYRRVILDKLAATAGLEDIEQRIVCEEALTPQDIHERYRVLNGAIYGLASHGRLRGGFKPANRSPDLDQLYFCGGSAHPGPGMPMVMMSGWIAADAADADLKEIDVRETAAA